MRRAAAGRGRESAEVVVRTHGSDSSGSRRSAPRILSPPGSWNRVGTGVGGCLPGIRAVPGPRSRPAQPPRALRSMRSSRSGSASTSMATMRPSVTVRAMSGTGRSAGTTKHSGRPVDENGPGDRAEPAGRDRLSRHRPRAVEDHGVAGARDAAVGAQDDLGVEDGDERLDVPVAGGGEEGVDGRPPAGEIGVGYRRLSLDAAAGPARELPGRGGGAIGPAARARPPVRSFLAPRHAVDLPQPGSRCGGADGRAVSRRAG